MATIQRIGSARYGRGPGGPLAVSVTEVRRGGLRGREFRLADDPEHALVRVIGDEARLGPCEGLLGDHCLSLGAHELPLLVRIVAAWREVRGGWTAYELGMRGPGGMYRRSAHRYRAGSWAPETLEDDEWLPGEIAFRASKAEQPGSVATLPVELTLDNERGDCVGVLLRTPAERCVVLVRGSILVSRSGPRRTEDLVKVADLLVLSMSETDDDGKLPMLEDAAEFDPFGAFVLEEAAEEVDPG